jgi:hypothetical protein
MPDAGYDFIDSALIGHLISISLLATLVSRGVISRSDAAEILDDSLLHLEEWQTAFPAHQKAFEGARQFLSSFLRGFESNPEIPPASSP